MGRYFTYVVPMKFYRDSIIDLERKIESYLLELNIDFKRIEDGSFVENTPRNYFGFLRIETDGYMFYSQPGVLEKFACPICKENIIDILKTIEDILINNDLVSCPLCKECFDPNKYIGGDNPEEIKLAFSDIAIFIDDPIDILDNRFLKNFSKILSAPIKLLHCKL